MKKVKDRASYKVGDRVKLTKDFKKYTENRLMVFDSYKTIVERIPVEGFYELDNGFVYSGHSFILLSNHDVYKEILHLMKGKKKCTK
jgi:hypothetical protein